MDVGRVTHSLPPFALVLDAENRYWLHEGFGDWKSFAEDFYDGGPAWNGGFRDSDIRFPVTVVAVLRGTFREPVTQARCAKCQHVEVGHNFAHEFQGKN